MFRFFSGVAVGIFIAQQYPGSTPPLRPIVDGLLRDAQKKIEEYNKTASPPTKET